MCPSWIIRHRVYTHLTKHLNSRQTVVYISLSLFQSAGDNGWCSVTVADPDILFGSGFGLPEGSDPDSDWTPGSGSMVLFFFSRVSNVDPVFFFRVVSRSSFLEVRIRSIWTRFCSYVSWYKSWCHGRRDPGGPPTALHLSNLPKLVNPQIF